MLLRLCYRSLPFTRHLSVTHSLSAGHNKWSKIKHTKGTEDAKKGAVYGKAARDIILSAKNGRSADPGKNHMLAVAVKNARANGVPKDTIEAALSRGARVVGGGAKDDDQQMTFEALAVGGSVGLIIECSTNNQNRTLHNVRDILTQNGAHFAPVGFMFERKGLVRVTLASDGDDDVRLESVIEQALASTADDFGEAEHSDGSVEVKFTCPPHGLAMLTSALTSPGATHELVTSELIYSRKRQRQCLHPKCKVE